MEKNFKKIVLVLFVLLVIIGTLFDLQINSYVEGALPIFGRFFEIFGEVPVFLITVLSTAILAATRNKEKKISSVLQLIGFSTYGLLNSILGGILIAGYIAKDGTTGDSHGSVGPISIVLAIIFGITIYVVCYFLAQKISKNNITYYRRIAYLGLLFTFLAIFVTNIIKIIWGRPRYWSVILGTSEFVPWYQISGPAPSNEFKSFPSGHAANAFTFIWFSLLAYRNTSLVSKIYIAGVLWGLCVASSRLFILQHYMTDVVFSGIFIMVIFEILLRAFKINKFKDDAPIL